MSNIHEYFCEYYPSEEKNHIPEIDESFEEYKQNYLAQSKMLEPQRDIRFG